MDITEFVRNRERYTCKTCILQPSPIYCEEVDDTHILEYDTDRGIAAVPGSSLDEVVDICIDY